MKFKTPFYQLVERGFCCLQRQVCRLQKESKPTRTSPLLSIKIYIMKKHYLLIFTFFAVLTTLAQIPQNGLVSSYRFEGTLTADSVGTNTLTTNGYPALATGYQSISNTGISFNSDGIIGSTSTDFHSNSFTFSCWVNLASANIFQTFGNVRLNVSSFPFNSFNLVAGTGVSNNLTFFYNTDEHLNDMNSTSDLYVQDLTGSLAYSTWYHVAVSVHYNAISNNSTVNLYKNGTLVNTAQSSGQIVYNGSVFSLGNVNGVSDLNNGLKGSLDEVLFYNRALTHSEICEMYHQYVGTNCALSVAAPSNLTATATGQQVNLSWNDNSNNESYFRVATSTDGINFSNILGDVAANSTNYSYTASPGTHYYRVFAYSVNDTSDVSNVATLTIVSIAGITSQNENTLSIYPNPTSESVNITSSVPTSIRLIASNGVELLQQTFENELKVDLSVFESGIYFIQTAEGKTYKIIKE